MKSASATTPLECAEAPGFSFSGLWWEQGGDEEGEMGGVECAEVFEFSEGLTVSRVINKWLQRGA